MSTTRSEPQTVKFRGIDDLVLVADEWNRGSDSGAATEATSDPARPSILLLHGGGQNRFSWKNTGQILAGEGFHVVALDSRGRRHWRCLAARWQILGTPRTGRAEDGCK